MGKDWTRLCSEAIQLSDEAGAELEAELETSPDEPETRLRLVGFYYLRDEMQPRRADHLLWLATHRPEIRLMGFGVLDESLAPAGHAALIAAWRANAARPDAGTEVLQNAADFIGLLGDDVIETEALIRRACALEPENDHWRQELARILIRRASDADLETRGVLVREAVSQLDEALALAPASRTILVRETLLDALVAAEDWERTVEVAERILIDNRAEVLSWNYGNAIHRANLALGWAARARGDLAAAAQFLLRAGATPGSPQLNSFGPDFELAEALLQSGDVATVRQYLECCRRFWAMHRGQLDRWLRAIDAGATTLERSYGEDEDDAIMET